MDDTIIPVEPVETTSSPLSNPDRPSRSPHKTSENVQWTKFLGWTLLAAAIAVVVAAELAHCETPGQLARVKDVATIEGIRDNQLVGYGLVVGLRGTGDSSQTVFPAQTLISALERMGVTVPQTGSNSASNMQVKTWRQCLLSRHYRPSAGPVIVSTLLLPRLVMRARLKAEFC